MQIIKNVTAIVIGCMCICTVYPQQKHALLIGINNYYSSPLQVSTSLKGCVNDALAVKATLINNYGFEENKITTLLNNQATKENVIVAFMSILKSCKAGDALVFYFSGHGVWMSNPSQSTFDKVVKRGMNQAIVMSNLNAPNLGCLMANATIKRLFNKAVEKKVILTSIFDCCFSGSMPMSIQISPNSFAVERPIEVEKSLPLSDLVGWKEEITIEAIQEVDKDVIMMNQLDSNNKSFNINNAITINDKGFIPRPSEIPNSNFCSLSGTNDVEKGIEIEDENGMYHGAYTKALLHTINTNKTNIPLQKLIQQVDEQMNTQLYKQSPTNHYDTVRLHQNIIGINASTFPKQIKATCIYIKKEKIVLNKGLINGIATGNSLYNKKTNSSATIVQSFLDSSIAEIKSNSVVKVHPNDEFILTDNYSSSPPLIKVYIHGNKISAAEFVTNFNAIIKPLTILPNYRDYNHFSMLDSTKGLFFNSNKAITQKSINNTIVGPFITMLSIPDFITNELIKKLQTNQNILLVNSLQDADMELYVHYCNTGIQKSNGFVFTLNNFYVKDNNRLNLSFSKYHVKVTTLPTDKLQLSNLINNLEQLVIKTIRAKSTRWLNDFPKR